MGSLLPSSKSPVNSKKKVGISVQLVMVRSSLLPALKAFYASVVADAIEHAAEVEKLFAAVETQHRDVYLDTLRQLRLEPSFPDVSVGKLHTPIQKRSSFCAPKHAPLNSRTWTTCSP